MNNYQHPNQFYPTGTTNNQVNYNNYKNDENFINQNDQKQQNNYTQNQDYNNLTQNMENMYLNSEYPSYQNHQTSPVNNQPNLQKMNEPIKTTNVSNTQQQYQNHTTQFNYQNQYNGNQQQYNNLDVNKTNQPIPNRNSTSFPQDYQQGLQQPNYMNQNNMTAQHQNNGYNWRMPTMNQPPMVPPNQMNSYPPPNSMVSPSMMNQPQQTKQIDPDNVPSVIQVTESDRNKFFTKDLTYSTTIPSDLPPNETTVYDNDQVFLKMIDNGCARPNHIRSSIYNVPIKEEILKNTSIPFNVVVKPFDEFEVDDKITVPVSQSEIIRCNRCKAYISPHMKFTDGGKRFQCSLCHHMNDVPSNYFVSLDHMEQRLDKYERPELHLGSYEFRTGQEFYRNKVLASRRPHIVFAFELTVNSKPLIQTISEHLIDVIKTSLPVDKIWNCPPPLVGFMTYNSKIQLYDIVNNGTSHIISDVSSTFPPFTTFLVDPITQIDKIEEFLKKLPSLYSDNELETETILGPVIEAAFQTCNADSSNWFPNQDVKDKSKVLAVGKIYLFHCSLPTFGQDGVTPGRLKKRWTTVDDEAKRLLGTDKEKLILTPETSKYYTKLGEKCVSEFGSGVELFLFPPLNGSFVDIATISELIRLTGTGGIYKYFNDFSPRFIDDLKRSLQSTMAFDVILKVRTSTGIRPVNYYGNYYFSNLYDVEFASLNAGNSISVEFKYDEKLNENQFVIIQVAALYTSVSGDRRVRVHNLVLPVCSQIGEVYRSANCDALMNHLFRSSIQSLRLGTKTIQDVKNALINRVVQILISYRLNCASPNSNSGQLILPETLKLLPVYLTGAIKCDAIDGGFEMSLDDKAFAQVKSLSANCFLSQKIFYPSLLRIQYNESNSLETVPLRCAFYRLDSIQGVGYILDNGFYLFLYLPSNPEIIDQTKFLRNVFGVNSLQEIKPENELPLLETEESIYINNVLDNIRQKRKMAMKVFIVRQNIDKNEIIFKSFLYEDNKLITSVKSGQNNFESPSYVDLLCHLHKEIRAHLQ